MLLLVVLLSLELVILCNCYINNNNNNHNSILYNKNNQYQIIKSNESIRLPSSLSLSSSSSSSSSSLPSSTTSPLLTLQNAWLKQTNQSKVYQDVTLVLLSMITGSVTGYLIQFLKYIVSILEIYRIRNPLIVPIIGTFIIGYMYNIRSDINIGPNSIYTNDDNAFSVNRQILRIIAIVIAVGTGNALALAGPAAELGMVIARVLGLGLLSTEESRRLLCLAGSAAGFAANFLTPISGVLFAMEFSHLQLVHTSQKQNSSSSVKPLIRSSLSFSMIAAFISIIFAKKGSIEPFKHFLSKYTIEMGSYDVLLSSAIIGVGSGIISKFYRSAVTNISSSLLLNKVPIIIKPMICGILCGLAALYGQPQSLAHGFISLDEIVSGRLTGVIPLLLFFTIRIIMLIIANSSGVLGGVVAPSIFVGASFGALINFLMNSIGLFSNTNSNHLTSILALVGASSCFSAFFKAPLTSSMLILEFTRNMDLAIPLLLATSLANTFSY